jgi:hypothetical protein
MIAAMLSADGGRSAHICAMAITGEKMIAAMAANVTYSAEPSTLHDRLDTR